MAGIQQLVTDGVEQLAVWGKQGASLMAAHQTHDNVESLTGFGKTLSQILVSDTSGDAGPIVQIISTFLNNVKSNLMVPLQGIGVALALMFLIVSLYNLAMEDRMSPEIFVKHIAKFGLAMIFISACPRFVDLIFAFADALANWAVGVNVNTANTTIPSLDSMYSTYYAACDAGLVNAWSLFFSNILQGMVFKLACGALTVVGYIVGFSRVIELSVREMSLPIAMGLLSDDGWRGAGGNYIRKFIAVACQSFVLIIIAKLTTSLMMTASLMGYNAVRDAVIAGALPGGKSIDSLMWSGMVVSLGCGIASVSVMFKSMNIVNDIFGAH